MTDPQAPAPPPREPISFGRHALCFGVVVVLVALDLWSKASIMPWLERGMTEFQGHPGLTEGPAAELVRSGRGLQRYPLIGEWLALTHNLNYGAAFGKLSGIQHLLVVGRCVAALVLSVLIFRTRPGQRIYLTSLVLILAGALGNLYDNFFYEPLVPIEGKPFGPVRDFIDVYFGIWDWHFPTFNIADSCITVGAILLLGSGLFAPKEPEEAEEAGEAAA